MTGDLAVRYEEYVAAFNARDLIGLEEFLDPQVLFEWGGVMADLDGRDAFLTFYREAWSHFAERIDARVVAVDDSMLTAWVETELDVFRDWPDCPIRPYRAGSIHRVAGMIRYRFAAGRIIHIAEIDLPLEEE